MIFRLPDWSAGSLSGDQSGNLEIEQSGNFRLS
jgi:hypothetical protein